MQLPWELQCLREYTSIWTTNFRLVVWFHYPLRQKKWTSNLFLFICLFRSTFAWFYSILFLLLNYQHIWIVSPKKRAALWLLLLIPRMKSKYWKIMLINERKKKALYWKTATVAELHIVVIWNAFILAKQMNPLFFSPWMVEGGNSREKTYH